MSTHDGWAPVFKSNRVYQGLLAFRDASIWILTEGEKIPIANPLVKNAKKLAQLILKNEISPLSLNQKIFTCLNLSRLLIDTASFPDTFLGSKVQQIFHATKPYSDALERDYPLLMQAWKTIKIFFSTLYNLDKAVHDLGHHIAMKVLIKPQHVTGSYCGYFSENTEQDGISREEFNALPLTRTGEWLGKNTSRTIYYLSGTVLNTAFSVLIYQVALVATPVFPVLGIILSNYVYNSTLGELYQAIEAITSPIHPDKIKGNDWVNILRGQDNPTEILRGSSIYGWIPILILYNIHSNLSSD
jgi:hypothetical protein